MFKWLLRAGLSVGMFLALFAAALIYLPNSPLPDRLNPTKALDPADQVSILTTWKLTKTSRDIEACHQALDALGARYQTLSDKSVSSECGISGRVEISGLSGVRFVPFETKCATALRLGMWLEHDVIPNAKESFDQELASLSHFGSYSCRAIRNSSGASRRMSEHATANAVDISGLTLTDGTKIILKDDWEDGEKGTFLAEIRTGACRWFNVTLSPDYNELHADHFHFDQGIWRSCR